MHPQIGFVGLGRMDLPLCAALAGAGYRVTATDERAGAQADAVACGAAWRDTPAQATAAAGVLITVLPSAREIPAVMLGEAGALAGMAAGTTWIDMTSSSPPAVRPVREQAMEAGIQVLEAPVGGGVQAAREGKLQRPAHSSTATWTPCSKATTWPPLGWTASARSSKAVTALARDHRVPFELSDFVYRTYRRALARYGPVDGELLGMALREDQAGQNLRSGQS